VPAAYAGLLAGLDQRHGRAGEGDSPVLAEVHLMLDPGAQGLAALADELRPVQEEAFRPLGLGGVRARAPGVDHGIDAGQLQERMVNGGVKDVGGRRAGAARALRAAHRRPDHSLGRSARRAAASRRRFYG
jgi:hypothetical protein